MGFSIKFNWVLQTEPAEKMEIGSSIAFEKTGNRVFPIDTAIDLIDRERTAIAKIHVVSFANTTDTTTGIYKIIRGSQDIFR